MILSAAGIPIEIPDLLGDLIKYLRDRFRSSRPLSRAQTDAMTVIVDETVARAITALERLLITELRWRESVFRGEAAYDSAIEEEFRSILKHWYDCTDPYFSGMIEFRSLGFYPPSLEGLRPCLDEVRSMLTPDGEFFEGEGLDELTTEALAEDERGETVEFRTMGE